MAGRFQYFVESMFNCKEWPMSEIQVREIWMNNGEYTGSDNGKLCADTTSGSPRTRLPEWERVLIKRRAIYDGAMIDIYLAGSVKESHWFREPHWCVPLQTI